MNGGLTRSSWKDEGSEETQSRCCDGGCEGDKKFLLAVGSSFQLVFLGNEVYLDLYSSVSLRSCVSPFHPNS